MKRLSLVLLLVVFMLFGCTDSKKPVYRIAVVQLMEHTSLNIIKDGIMEQLKNLGYVDQENCEIYFENAQGEMSNLTTIMQTLESKDLDVIITITTPCAQSAMMLTEKVPMVFAAVTDPVGAKLVEALDKTDNNITGTSDLVQVNQIIDMAMQLNPEAKKVGYIYNPGEDNSVSNLKILQEYANKIGLEVVSTGISSGADMSEAANYLCSKVDFIFVGNDNTVAESMPVLAKIAIDNQIQVYTGADSMVKDGGFATIGIDYQNLGIETANMADQILKGKPTSEIPVKVFDQDLYIYINENTAKALNVTLPATILENEKLVMISGE